MKAVDSSHKEKSPGRQTLREVWASLERHEPLALVMGSGSDEFLFWEWMQAKITRLCPHVEIFSETKGPTRQTASAGRLQRIVTLRSSRANRAPVARSIELPPLVFNDLLHVLYARRREQVLHHGILIPRLIQKYALELCYQQHNDDSLVQAFDVIDAAAIVLQQSTLALATTEEDVRSIEGKMIALAGALRAASGLNLDSSYNHAGPRGCKRILTAVREFERQVLSLGGRAGAASLSAVEVEVVFRNLCLGD